MKVAFHTPKNPNWYEWLIIWRCKSPIVHTEFVFDEFDLNGKWLSFSSVIHVGARFQQSINFFTSEWLLIDLPKGDVNKAFDYCKGMEGKAYDLPAILGFMTPWSQRNDHDIYCTESTVDIIQYEWKPGTIFPLQTEPWRVAPCDLYKLMSKHE